MPTARVEQPRLRSRRSAGHSDLNPYRPGADGDPADGGEGGQVADFEESRIRWRKSTASSGGTCVEVAVADGSVLIRDSANPGGPVLRVPTSAWPALLASARERDFDSSELGSRTELTEH